MVRFKIKSNPNGQYYFPKEVRDELGNVLELVANSRAAVLFPAGAPLEFVLKSLEVIKLDLQNRLEFENSSKKFYNKT